MNMLYLVISLFALGAMVGLYLLTLVLSNKETPKGVCMIHGAFVATALVLLIVYATKHGPGLLESIVLFSMAAMGGLYMFFRDVTGNKVPKWLAVGHGLLAVTGFIFLLVYAF